MDSEAADRDDRMARPGNPTEAAPGSAARWDLLALLIVGAAWGSAYPVIRAGIVAGAPPLVFAAVRYGGSALALLPIAYALRSPRPDARSFVVAVAYGGVLIIGLYGALLYLGEQSTSGGLSAVIAASATFWSVLFGFVLLPQERLRPWELAGLLVGFAGVAILVVPQIGTGGGIDGPLLVVAAIISFAIGGVLLRRAAPASPSLWTLSAQFAVAGGLVGGFSLALGEPWTLGHLSITGPALVYLVAVPSLLGYVLYFGLHHRVGPARANLVAYVAPVAGVLVALLVFAESVSLSELAGLGLIIVGLLIVHRVRARAPRVGSTGAR
jgi:probable blue pigment (indigoidine) exporter